MSLLKVENLGFGYEKNILKNINFAIDKVNFISLLGVNGAGKSTLLKNINRLLKPQEGVIYIDGKKLVDIKNKELARKIAYVSQYNSPTQNTVFDTVLAGRAPHIKGNPCKSDYKVVEEILEKMALKDYALRYTSTLSGGEYQRVVLARALAQEPKLLLLDEPTSNLDIKNQIDVMKMVKEFSQEKGVSVIISIHDINLSLQFSNNFIMLKDGEIHALGNSDIINSENIKKVYGIDVEILEYNNRKILVNI